MGLETLAVASIATSLAGAGMSAYGQYQAGKAQNEMAKRNAKATDQARQAEASGKIQTAMIIAAALVEGVALFGVVAALLGVLTS